jgi:excisionase family DNA binding protein
MMTIIVRDITFRVDKLYAIKEVAIILGVSTKTVSRWVSEGKLKAYRLGDGPKAPVRIHGRTVLGLLKKVSKITQKRQAAREPKPAEEKTK